MILDELINFIALGNEPRRNSLEFSEPGVSNKSSKNGCEVAEAAEGMVDGG